jgi:mono/diheme cytochrome c family protein
MKIHPVFIMTAPIMVLVSCAQYGAGSPPAPQTQQPSVARTLFLRNCAHCHGADAHGDDGPDLHDIGWTNDQIASRIQKGKAGQMTAFAGKLKPAEIDALMAYVQSLK